MAKMKRWTGTAWEVLDAKNCDTVDNIHFRVNNGTLEYDSGGGWTPVGVIFSVASDNVVASSDAEIFASNNTVKAFIVPVTGTVRLKAEIKVQDDPLSTAEQMQLTIRVGPDVPGTRYFKSIQSTSQTYVQVSTDLIVSEGDRIEVGIHAFSSVGDCLGYVRNVKICYDIVGTIPSAYTVL